MLGRARIGSTEACAAGQGRSAGSSSGRRRAAMLAVLGVIAIADLWPAGAHAAPTVTEFTGGVTSGFTANGLPSGISAGPDGNVWFTEAAGPGRVARITSAGQVTEYTGGTAPGFSAFGFPLRIAIGPDANLWFTQAANPGRVARVTLTGQVTEFTGGVTSGFSANGVPVGLAAGPDGTLWFAQQADPGRLGRLTNGVGEFTGGTGGFSANGLPSAIVAGPDGNMWFTQAADPGRVARITSAGQVTEFTGVASPPASAPTAARRESRRAPTATSGSRRPSIRAAWPASPPRGR